MLLNPMLLELDPFVTRGTDPEHLCDPAFHLAAFRLREQHTLSSVARRLKRRLDHGMELTQALVECQNHLVEMAQAHVEQLILERFRAAVEACEDRALHDIRERLAVLFAVSRLEQDRGWFLEHGYFEPAKARGPAQAGERALRRAAPAGGAAGERFRNSGGGAGGTDCTVAPPAHHQHSARRRDRYPEPKPSKSWAIVIAPRKYSHPGSWDRRPYAAEGSPSRPRLVAWLDGAERQEVR